MNHPIKRKKINDTHRARERKRETESKTKPKKFEGLLIAKPRQVLHSVHLVLILNKKLKKGFEKHLFPYRGGEIARK